MEPNSLYHIVTNTVEVPNRITGFRPYRSATTPQKMDVNALPTKYAHPSYDKGTHGYTISVEVLHMQKN